MQARTMMLFTLVLLSDVALAQTAWPCKGKCLTLNNNAVVGEIRTLAFGTDSRDMIEQLASNGWVVCTGQSAIRKDFDELWKAIGPTWGAADKTNVFYLPDLRGLFLRGWSADKKAPPKYARAPFGGDPGAGNRLAPRPEAGDAGGIAGSVDGAGNFTANHVGSLQADEAGPHIHRYMDGYTDQSIQSAHDNRNPAVRVGLADVKRESDPNAGQETRPVNAYVMYVIYVGKPATIAEPSQAEKDAGATGRIRPK